MESHRTIVNQTGDSKGRPATLTSRLTNSSPAPAARNHLTSRQHTSSPGLSSSSGSTTLTTNSKTSRPSTPTSRTTSPSPRANSVEPGGRPRRQSCSPSRGRSPMYTSVCSVPAVNRGYSKGHDNVSPVLMGAKMVERVINMRKLAPPRLDEKGSSHGSLSAKSSSPDSAGFGRTLSKKSLDMAIRHMVRNLSLSLSSRESETINDKHSSIINVQCEIMDILVADQ